MEKNAGNARFKMMTETPVPALIRKLSAPTIISMLVTGIYNTADTFFVGKISTQATAAVGLVFSIMAIIQALGFFCGHGSGNYLSRMLGAGKTKEANDMASTGFALALIIGCLVAGIGILNLETLARFVGATPTTMQDTMDYMRIILLGAPFMCGQFVVNNQLRFQGSAVYAMIGLLSGAIINIGLDPLLMFAFGLGVKGAALATISGQLVSFLVLLVGSRQGENIRLSIQNVHINGHFLLEIANGGAPSLLRQGLAAISTLLLNTIAGQIGGDAAIAGMSVVTRVMMLVSSALIGFGQGYQPVCSFNSGAGLKERVREGYYYCVKIGTIFLLIFAVICFVFAPGIVGWFRDDPDVIIVGAAALRWQAISLPFNATIVMTNMMLQSMGKGVKASVMASARNGLFFIPLILILPRLLQITGVEMTQAVSDICSFALAIPIAASELKKMKKQ